MNLTTYKKTQNVNGVTYYKLISKYNGDVTKNCSLLGTEVDSNFYFLRGNDIADAQWDDAENTLYLIRENGNKLAIKDFTSHVNGEGSYFDSGSSVFHMVLNGVDFPVDGFYVKTCCDELLPRMDSLEEDMRCLELYVSGITEELFNEIADVKEDLSQAISGVTDELQDLDKRIDDLEFLKHDEKEIKKYIDDKIQKEQEERIKYDNILNEKFTDSVEALDESIGNLEAKLEDAVSGLSSSISLVETNFINEINEINNKIDNINVGVVDVIYSGETLVNEFGEVDLTDKIKPEVDLSNYYTKDEIHENELVVAAALNELKSDIEALKEKEPDLSDYYTKDEIDGKENTINDALNDLQEQINAKADTAIADIQSADDDLKITQEDKTTYIELVKFTGGTIDIDE